MVEKVGAKVGWVGEEGVGGAGWGKGWGEEAELNKLLSLWLEERGVARELN